MKILFLCEGSPDERHSWSGTAYSVARELRDRGHQVIGGDVELRGLDRWTAAGLTFSPQRDRWGTKFRLGRASFERRSRRAARYAGPGSPEADVILQIGATFEPRDRAVPYALYCDSNIRMAERGLESGYSDAVFLSERERRAIVDREAKVYRDASAIFTLSERLRRSFIEDFAIPPSKVVAVGAGPNLDVDLSSMVRAPDDPARRPTVLFVGKQFERKGGPQLLEAFRLVRTRVPDARLVIVGPERVDGADDGVECLGYLSKRDPDQARTLKKAYATADVFCLPTKFEPFGVVFLEAMFYGLPCIGPDAWAVPEMIRDGESGFTFPTEDTGALANRLIELLTNRQLARRFGAAGQSRARREYTWPAVVGRMLERLEPLASEREPLAVLGR